MSFPPLTVPPPPFNPASQVLLPEGLRQPTAFSNKVVIQQAFRPQMLEKLPWLHKGDFIFDELQDQYFYLARSENMPEFVHAFASNADGTTTGIVRMDVNATDLETDRLTLFFQYFPGVRKDGFTYEYFPLGEQVFTSDKLLPATTNNNTRARAFIDPRSSPFEDPNEFGQFFMRKGLSVGFEYFNNTGLAQIQKIRFLGRKFERALVVRGSETRLRSDTQERFPLVLEVSPEDWRIAVGTARPLFLRRIAGS